MTPFRSGLPVDAIPHVEWSVEDCPDLSMILSLLASCMHCPSPGHLDAT